MLNLCKTLLGELRLRPTSVSPTTAMLHYSVRLLIEIITITGSFIHLLRIMDHIDEAIESGFVCFAFITTIFIYTWMIVKKYKIEQSIDDLECYVNERIKHDEKDGELSAKELLVENEHLYKEAEEQYTTRAHRYIYSWFGIVCFYGIVLLIVPVIDVIHGQMNASNWTTLFRKAYPIDEHKISSFFIHYALDFGTCFIHFTIYSTACTYHMATAIYVSAMVSDVKLMLERCDAIMSSRDLQPSTRNTNLKDGLQLAISLHANILNLSKLVAKNVSGVLFIIIVNSIVFMAAGLFQMEMETKAGAFEVYVSLNSVMLQFTLIWYFCSHSDLVSTRLGQVSDFVYSMCWYRFPCNLQRATAMMIQQSNERFEYSGLGILTCNMQTLSMIVKSVVSYYLLLKKI